jgi:hypothetical protein
MTASAKINWRNELAQRLGLAPDVDQAELLAALDRALTIPDGVQLIDAEVLNQLRVEVELGRTHRERALVEQAIRAGKIPPASRASWVTLLQTDPNAEATLAGIKPGTLPTKMVGYGQDRDDVDSDEALLRQLFPDI